jgi:hypothetical protein
VRAPVIIITAPTIMGNSLSSNYSHYRSGRIDGRDELSAGEIPNRPTLRPIVTEMNSQIAEAVPTGRSVACAHFPITGNRDEMRENLRDVADVYVKVGFASYVRENLWDCDLCVTWNQPSHDAHMELVNQRLKTKASVNKR